METSTNQKQLDMNRPPDLKVLQSTSSFWSPLKAIPITSLYKLHRVPSFTPMAELDPAGIDGDASSNTEPSKAEPEPTGINGDASSHTGPSTSSRPVGLVSPNGTALPLGEPFVEPIPDKQVPPNRLELPRSEPSGRPVREEQIPPHGIHNKLLEQVIRTPGRQPSPLPTHLSIPGPSHYRVLREEGPGYVAPRFEGKEQQMEQGKLFLAELVATRLIRFI